jgi:uncharacterized protein (TIGR03083 family)
VNDDELWAAIDTQRLRTAELLESLAPQEWDHPSLCEGWRVRDVAAHLTMQQMSLGGALLGALRHPGSVNHMIREGARDRAKLPEERLIDEIRGTVGSRRHNTGVTPLETLIDIVVHGQDIAIPLGRSLEVAPDVAATAASRVWSYGARRWDRIKMRVFRRFPYWGYRLTATDFAWSVGDGPDISGPVLSILLLLTGRPVGLTRLSGDGAAALAGALDLARS